MSQSTKLIKTAGGWDAVSVVFDIGANDGAAFISLAAKHPEVEFVAIEPTPRLADALRQESAELSNYTVVQCAVSTTDGQAEFNVIDGHRGGLNSLLSPRPYLFDNWATSDEVETVQVETRRLDSLARDLGVTRIDVLHVDAQGADLDVLRSTGSLLGTIRAGAVETTRPEQRLYDETPNPDDVAHFLWDAGLSIVWIAPNDLLGAEQNIVFARRSVRRARVYRRLYPLQHRLATNRLVVRAQHVRTCLGLRSRLLRVRRLLTAK